ncbi:MAG: hypothetical protein SF002_11920 [Alphaproteobacteria bacterium]|nr:hypothetical protein [Alphaproteobacteria bacterium]
MQSVEMTQAERAEFYRRRRGRNVAVMLALLGLTALFFAITVVQVGR